MLDADAAAIPGKRLGFGPFFNDKKTRIEPNYSFDLCRLGCSIYDFILDETDNNINDMDDLQKIIYTWCLDDSGRNILYKKNGEERYPNFKLYKMIARTVHNHTTDSQFENPIFKKFLSKNYNQIENIVDIDSIPCYA